MTRSRSLDLNDLSRLDARSKKRELERTFSNSHSHSDVEKGFGRKDKRTKDNNRKKTKSADAKFGSSTTGTQSTVGDIDFLTTYTVDLNDTNSRGPQPVKRVISSSRSVGSSSQGGSSRASRRGSNGARPKGSSSKRISALQD